jgi:hypothetical protein
MQTLCTYMTFFKVTHGQWLKNTDGDFVIIECQVGECSALCTGVSDKLMLSHKESVKDHDHDTLPK